MLAFCIIKENKFRCNVKVTSQNLKKILPCFLCFSFIIEKDLKKRVSKRIIKSVIKMETLSIWQISQIKCARCVEQWSYARQIFWYRSVINETHESDTISGGTLYIPSSASYVYGEFQVFHRPNLHGTFVPARLPPSKSLRYIVKRQGRSYCYVGTGISAIMVIRRRWESALSSHMRFVTVPRLLEITDFLHTVSSILILKETGIAIFRNW